MMNFQFGSVSTQATVQPRLINDRAQPAPSHVTNQPRLNLSSNAGTLPGLSQAQCNFRFESNFFRSNINAKTENCQIDTSTQTGGELNLNNFMQKLKDQLQSGQFSDVTLNVRGKEFKTHKNILAAHSPVFAAMMEHDTKEKATGIVNIEDGEPDTFADFLHCIYSGNTKNLNSENVVDLYTLADKYQFTELRQACVTYMMNHISSDSFCDIMALSLQHHEKELTEVATKYFLQNAIDISKTAKWLVFLKENIVAGNELFIKALGSVKQERL